MDADAGSQYRSAIFWSAPEQEKVARQVTERANRQWWDGRIVTEIVQAGEWWNAEDYHQEYLHKNPYGYQCPTHHVRKLPDLKYD
ncbi:Peptide methionine sulfoxide reductase MsrA [Zalerion maritima]|uniref:peptide-methionine (S)-S-oxide reductase n=1 Tax=Zalerion maritima TaxID=339359 RepID=A0AAD5RIE6_9PEZI|nr:Peptide methionine sulfoxide reductase MsrA [Zalerion maritima]